MGSIIVADLQINSYDIYYIGYPKSLLPFGPKIWTLWLFYVVNSTHLKVYIYLRLDATIINNN